MTLWPEAVYCCFTRTTFFTALFTIRVIGCYHVTKFRYSTPSSFRLLNVLPDAIYCCFTRITLFISMFTVIIVAEKYVYTKFHLYWLLCE